MPSNPISTSPPENLPVDCSVCLVSHPSSLAVLKPCRHTLCRSCLTSALNLVGERDMECAVCKQSVADFNLINVSSRRTAESKIEPNDSISANGNGELESAFEFGLDLASTPEMEQHLDVHSFASSSAGKKGPRTMEDDVVLRIDNVPWDITPGQISKWLQQPVERIHILMDPKGKTLSHAYVEVKTAAIAGAILRGEAASSLGRKERGNVLGKGRRARGVTITRSGQQELMTDLFPRWRGGFDGSRPSLAGLEGDRVIGALDGGLMTENEISGLLHLIREPDSHFLKVPSLPFHSLANLLAKFPTDIDSRVFWSAGVRDLLFDATYTAIPILLSRVEKAKDDASKNPQNEDYTMSLLVDLLHCALNCKAFTAQHTRSLTDLAEVHSLPLPDGDVSHLSESSDLLSASGSSAPRTPASDDNPTLTSGRLSGRSQYTPDKSLDDLAKEFGVDAQVVHALAKRLAKVP